MHHRDRDALKLQEELIHDDYLCRNPEKVNDEIVHRPGIRDRHLWHPQDV